MVKRRVNNDEYIGKRFGKWTVIGVGEYSKRQHALFECRCDCGKVGKVEKYILLHGKSKCCGCEHPKARKHGEGSYPNRTRLYRIWQGIKDRCNNPRRREYKHYGGRGIRICDEWENDYLAFKYWSLANGYTDELTIDRIDVNGNYEPDNCRWVDMKIQSNNTTRNIYLTHNGKTQSLKMWCEELNVDYENAKYRYERGYDFETIMTKKTIYGKGFNKPVVQLDKDGNFVKEYSSQTEAFKQTGVRQTGISCCCLNKTQTSGGYRWRFKGDYEKEKAVC